MASRSCQARWTQSLRQVEGHTRATEERPGTMLGVLEHRILTRDRDGEEPLAPQSLSTADLDGLLKLRVIVARAGEMLEIP